MRGGKSPKAGQVHAQQSIASLALQGPSPALSSFQVLEHKKRKGSVSCANGCYTLLKTKLGILHFALKTLHNHYLYRAEQRLMRLQVVYFGDTTTTATEKIHFVAEEFA